MVLNKKLVKYNYNTGRGGNSIKYIVIHDTGNTSKGADAEAHYKYFNGGNRGASAHYFVDDKQCIQIIEDSNTAWHVGDGKGAYGITNQNSIGIEICINADCNYLTAVSNAVDLTKQLMKKYNIPADRVVRHYDASRKSCPNSMKGYNWSKWNDFKKRLVSPVDMTIANGDFNRKVRLKCNLNMRQGRGTNYTIVKTLPKGTIITGCYCLDGWLSTYDHTWKDSQGKKNPCYFSADKAYIEVL